MNETNGMNNYYSIIDASVFIKAHIINPDQERCLLLLNKLKKSKILVPSLWLNEVTSVLAKLVHFGQITPQESKDSLRLALTLDFEVIEPDNTQCQLALEWAHRLNRASAYDCFYLAIADSYEIPFWTADKRLYNALKDMNLIWLNWIFD
jgi:predicted nucleic acid-binding protein